jgi:hypothetical protein
MKKIFFTMLVFATVATKAQVGIGVAATDVDASAQLEVKSTTKGLLSPRMTEAQKNAISTPATGLLIYQTDETSGFYYYDGSIWKQGLGPQGVAGAAGASGQTNTSLLFSTSAIYADGAAPADAPSSVTSTYGNFGWYFKNTNTVPSRKINWYLQPKSSTMRVGDLTGLYLEFFNVAITNAADMPFIVVYTKPTGSGDAAPWYKSRRYYTFSGSPSANTKYLGFANFGALSPNTYNTSLLNLVEGPTSGTFASTEEIIFISIASSSASAAGACEFVANKFGVITGASTDEFLFMPPSSIANLSGYATSSSLNTEVLRAQAAEATLTSSVNDLTNNVSQNSTQINDLQIQNVIQDDQIAQLQNQATQSSFAVQSLTSALDVEVSRAQSAEATLTSSLATKANIASPSFTGIATAEGFKTPNGTSSQYLMADGSVSSGVSSPTYAVGDSYGGGIVFYVTPDGKHGLISETQLISPNSNSSQNEDIYNFSQAQNMISNPNNHSTNGKLFTDWRLPTSYEFSVLYANKSYFSLTYQGRLNYYNWTSTPAASPNETSKMVYYYNGVAGEAGFNGGPCGVIAVRSF